MQQTPKALAQFPSAVPADEHSVEVIQTPFNPAVDVAWHSLKYNDSKNWMCVENSYFLPYFQSNVVEVERVLKLKKHDWLK